MQIFFKKCFSYLSHDSHVQDTVKAFLASCVIVQPFFGRPLALTSSNKFLKMEEEVDKEERVGKVMEGVGSIALLPCGSLSGHFVHLPNSVCYGLHGTEIACERECSRGEDYRLIKLTITDYNSKRERDVVVECRGHDAARLCNVDHAHGWEKDVVGMLDQKHGKRKVYVSFDCETLKAEGAAEDHIRKFMPKLAGMDAVVNIGPMSITGLEFNKEDDEEQIQQNVPQ